MTLTLLYDGGCPFCRNFAARSELSSGVRGLQIIDGREDHALRQSLSERGFSLAKGAVLIEGETVWHGSAAIAELCRRMEPSHQLLEFSGHLSSVRWEAQTYDLFRHLRDMTCL